MNVGDIFVSIRGDGSKLPADATKAATDAGDAAGKSFGARFGISAGDALRVAARVAGAVLTGATALAVQGQDAMAHFRAETGATQQEAEAAFASMNRLAASNLQSFGTVADVLTQVRTQMGLTGAEAEAMANRILKWSTATGQDAVEATKSFDDILDAWNLTASDSQAIMDALIVSHQKYGGSVSESESALKALAPALTAANMKWTDAIGLINLANAAGIEAADMVPALQHALTKVHSPQQLQTLIADIGTTTNSFDRSRKAADLFGARAGAKLGAALGASHGDITQYQVDIAKAAGATDTAAQAIEDTLPNKIKLAISGAMSTLRGFGTDLGPALTGSAALVSLGASFAKGLHLDSAVGAVGKKAWGVLTAQAATAGAEAGAAWAGAEASGGLLGAVGAALAAAAPIAIPVTIAIAGGIAFSNIQNDAATNRIYQEHTKALNDWIQAMGVANALQTVTSRAISTASAEDARNLALASQAWGSNADAALASGYTIQDAIKQMKDAGWTDADIAKLGNSAVDAWKAVVTNSVAYLQGHAHDAADTIVRETHATTDPGFKALGTSAGESFGSAFAAHFADNNPTLRQAAANVANNFLTGVQDSHYQTKVSDVLTHMWTAPPTAPAKQLGIRFGDAFIGGFKSVRDEARSQWAEFLDTITHPKRTEKTASWAIGKLMSSDLARGLRSGRPDLRAAAEEERSNLIAVLQKSIDAGYPIGQKTLAKLGLGIENGKIVALQAAQQARDDIQTTMSDTSGYYDGGRMIGNAWASGLAAAIRSGVARAEDALRGYHGPMIGESPPKTGPLKYIDRGGYNVGRAWRDSFLRGIDPRDGLSGVLGGLPLGLGYAASGMTGSLAGSGNQVTVRHEFGILPVSVDGRNLPPGVTGDQIGRAIGDRLSGVLLELDRMRPLPVGPSFG